MKSIPKITIKYSLETEADRILYTAHKTITGQYQGRDFAVVPSLPSKGRFKTVVLPDLDYGKINQFWQRVAKIIAKVPTISPASLLKEVETFITPHYHESNFLAWKKRYQAKLMADWPKLYADLADLFPNHIASMGDISIILTNYGTISSYKSVKRIGSKITLYLRTDSNFNELYINILTTILRPYWQSRYHYTWEEVKIAIEALFTTKLGRFISKGPTLYDQIKSTQHGQLIKQSEKYLTKLGLTAFSWEIKGDRIYYQDKTIKNLRDKELKLLTSLILSRGQIVTYDDLEDILWSDPGDFSLWAISKTVQRLRQALSTLNIDPHLIQAHRGVGYSLQSKPVFDKSKNEISF